jgi:hypothetical protein
VLSIWTGGITLKESNYLGSLTGNLQTEKEFYSQNNYITMQLSMDNSNRRYGFTANYETGTFRFAFSDFVISHGDVIIVMYEKI